MRLEGDYQLHLKEVGHFMVNMKSHIRQWLSSTWALSKKTKLSSELAKTLREKSSTIRGISSEILSILVRVWLIKKIPGLSTSRNALNMKISTFPYSTKYIEKHCAFKSTHYLKAIAKALLKLVGISILIMWTEFCSITVELMAMSLLRSWKASRSWKMWSPLSTRWMRWTRIR